MKADLDGLMAERGLDALVVTSDEMYCPMRDYLSNGARVGGTLIVKRQGDAPLLFCNPMEVEEARASGLTVYTFNDLGRGELARQLKGDRLALEVEMWARALAKAGVNGGKIGVYGTGTVHHIVEVMRTLEERLPDYTFVGERGLSLFDAAYLTKDADEIARLKSVAARTSAVARATWDFISGHRADGDRVVKADGAPLTIGDVKRFVRRALLDRDLEDTDMIFAQGRDGGFPHSRGQADTPLRTGQAIVFDLFPREIGGGYHHDMTRTWCIGHAPDNVRAAYEQVLAAFNLAVDTYAEPGQPAHILQDVVQDYFEAQGHLTSRSDPSATTGYMHSLGHGLGLNIHERPSLSHVQRDDLLQVGSVITIEPGLYYPDDGFGVRLEDTLYIADDGALVTLTDFHKDLVLPLKG
jgi:Xaa-Pro aminopeptidase